MQCSKIPTQSAKKPFVLGAFISLLFLLPIGIILALFNFLRFGSIFESGYGSEATSFSLQFFKRDWFDYLFSFERGIFSI